MTKLEKQILAYYNSDKFKLILPTNTNFRHFRFRRAGGTWLKLPIKVNSTEKLKNWIIAMQGVDLFYSTSRWYNPQKVGAKGGSGSYMIADNLVLGNDLVFDIDAKEPITIRKLDLARKSAWNIYWAMLKHKKRFELNYVALTGFKGLRLTYKDKQLMPADPRKRVRYIEKNRKLFIERLLNYIKKNRSNQQIYKIHTFCDEGTTVNPMSVIRIIGSAHSRTGYISTIFNPELLRKPIKHILANVPYIGKRRPGISGDREMTRGRRKNSSSALLKSVKDVSGLASLPNYTFFITNRVLGCRRCYIPMLMYLSNQQYYKKIMRKLQKKHSLGTLYIFKSNKNTIVISLKVMQKRQLQGILDESKSIVRYKFKKYGRIFAPYIMKLKETMPAVTDGQISKGHSVYINPTINTKKQKGQAGWPMVEIVKATR